MNGAGPLETLLNEVERSIEHKLYYLAIMLSLALPDICVALEDTTGRSGNKKKYMNWYNAYVLQRLPTLAAEDCFSLRGGVVHQGSSGVVTKGGKRRRVLFTIPDESGNVVHGVILSDVLQFDTRLFCNAIAFAVRDWFQVAQHDATVQANLPNLVQYRPQGLKPYIVGLPLIA